MTIRETRKKLAFTTGARNIGQHVYMLHVWLIIAPWRLPYFVRGMHGSQSPNYHSEMGLLTRLPCQCGPQIMDHDSHRLGADRQGQLGPSFGSLLLCSSAPTLPCQFVSCPVRKHKLGAASLLTKVCALWLACLSSGVQGRHITSLPLECFF